MAEHEDKHDDHGGGGGHGHGGGGHGHGGGGHEEGHEGAPEWLISFADNVALMMGFFVILLAMNMAKSTAGGIGGEKAMGGGTPETVELIDFALAMREGFNNPVSIDSAKPEEQQLVQRLIERAGKGNSRDKGFKGKEEQSQSIRPNNYRTPCGTVRFAENSIEINAQSLAVIADAAKKVQGMRLVIEVRGHVSTLEAQRGPEQAMHLAGQRAELVARSLAAEGVDWWQMRLVVCSDHDRLAAFPSSASADRVNSRVEIVATDEVVTDQVPTQYESDKSEAATPEAAASEAKP